eukprot:TRINITY_DN18256_c0_g2_i1.p1 TRINITY_DN18256_c0_g2~~TRINITY_DN18256_c0_g2_i1.p1  ORF type:complete len:196 (+),score=6.44 TRINITY_DN18256_c0_g2_i1:211-798(+)
MTERRSVQWHLGLSNAPGYAAHTRDWRGGVDQCRTCGRTHSCTVYGYLSECEGEHWLLQALEEHCIRTWSWIAQWWNTACTGDKRIVARLLIPESLHKHLMQNNVNSSLLFKDWRALCRKGLSDLKELVYSTEQTNTPLSVQGWKRKRSPWEEKHWNWHNPDPVVEGGLRKHRKLGVVKDPLQNTLLGMWNRPPN